MFGLVVIVAVVALALTMTIRIHNRLVALRRQVDEAAADADGGERLHRAVDTYNAAIVSFPARLIARTLGFHARSAET